MVLHCAGHSRLSWTLLDSLCLYLGWIVDSDGAKGARKGRIGPRYILNLEQQITQMLFCRIKKIDKSGGWERHVTIGGGTGSTVSPEPTIIGSSSQIFPE